MLKLKFNKYQFSILHSKVSHIYHPWKYIYSLSNNLCRSQVRVLHPESHKSEMKVSSDLYSHWVTHLQMDSLSNFFKLLIKLFPFSFIIHGHLVVRNKHKAALLLWVLAFREGLVLFLKCSSDLVRLTQDNLSFVNSVSTD